MHDAVTGTKQTVSTDPLAALVPIVLAGASCAVAKLFHRQHKQQRDLKKQQGQNLSLQLL